MIKRYPGCCKLFTGFLVVKPIIYANFGRGRGYDLRYAVFIGNGYNRRVISFLPVSVYQNVRDRRSILVKNFDSPKVFPKANGQALDHIIQRSGAAQSAQGFNVR